jgi:hypothetical protein
VLELDTEGSPFHRGVFFRMAWQLYHEPPPHIRLFILACRWHDRPHQEWLPQVRAMLQVRARTVPPERGS